MLEVVVGKSALLIFRDETISEQTQKMENISFDRRDKCTFKIFFDRDIRGITLSNYCTWLMML